MILEGIEIGTVSFVASELQTERSAARYFEDEVRHETSIAISNWGTIHFTLQSLFDIDVLEIGFYLTALVSEFTFRQHQAAYEFCLAVELINSTIAVCNVPFPTSKSTTVILIVALVGEALLTPSAEDPWMPPIFLFIGTNKAIIYFAFGFVLAFRAAGEGAWSGV